MRSTESLIRIQEQLKEANQSKLIEVNPQDEATYVLYNQELFKIADKNGDTLSLEQFGSLDPAPISAKTSEVAFVHKYSKAEPAPNFLYFVNSTIRIDRPSGGSTDRYMSFAYELKIGGFGADSQGVFLLVEKLKEPSTESSLGIWTPLPKNFLNGSPIRGTKLHVLRLRAQEFSEIRGLIEKRPCYGTAEKRTSLAKILQKGYRDPKQTLPAIAVPSEARSLYPAYRNSRESIEVMSDRIFFERVLSQALPM